MCIVIDINAIPTVFNPDVQDHVEFEPVFNWINNGDGKMVYGGTKYKEELGRLHRYLGIIRELSRKGKTTLIDTGAVDLEETYIKAQNVRGFNDHHIVAIIRASRCRLVCSKDKESFPHIKRPDFYDNGLKPPKIYSGKRNRDLLCNDNIICCGNTC